MQNKSQDGVKIEEVVEITEEKKQWLISHDKDFINCPDFDNSFKNLLASSTKKKFSDAFIRKVLMIDDQEKLDEIFNVALNKLRLFLKDGDDE